MYCTIPLKKSGYKCCSFMLILIYIVLKLHSNMIDILHTETSRGVNSNHRGPYISDDKCPETHFTNVP